MSPMCALTRAEIWLTDSGPTASSRTRMMVSRTLPGAFLVRLCIGRS